MRTALLLLVAALAHAQSPTFYKDVLPILQARCQECHRKNEAAPMPFTTYDETRPWAKAIRQAVLTGKMPPWFADPCCGKFANDRSLTAAEKQTLAQWADAGSAKGNPADAPPSRIWTLVGNNSWNIPKPDVVLEMSKPFRVPAKGAVEYQYFPIPTGFIADRWIQAVEIRPSNRAVVHHAVAYIREPGNDGPINRSDILAVYTPGTSPDIILPKMARLLPAGSDIVLEMHYTPNGKASEDRTQIGLVFAAAPPEKRVLTLQMDNESFVIPPGERNYKVSVWGTLPNDALLLGFFPHMHLRGTAFEYLLIHDDGRPEPLLLAKPYDFYWQVSYKLATPMPLKKGTRLNWTAWYDNSAANPRNPDPKAEVRYGYQSWEEMMVGFFDVAVDPGVDRKAFFVR